MAGTTARKAAEKAATTVGRGRRSASKPAEPAGTSTQKVPAQKTRAQKTGAQKTPTREATTAKAPAARTAAKAPAKKVPDARPAAAKVAAKRSPAPNNRTAPAKGATRPSAAAARQLAVKAGEKPWTVAELTEVRHELEADHERLMSELNLARHELHDLMRDAGDGAGNDQADVGSTTFERDHEMSLANNARLMLEQTERALARIDDGSYGRCESCGEPIGKMRVMAFPRATLCLSCKQREERR